MNTSDSTSERQQELLQAALDLSTYFKVIPLYEPKVVHSDPDQAVCSCDKGKECPNTGKHPRIPAWNQLATSDETTIENLWEAWPTANIGIHCEGLLVLDIDDQDCANPFIKEHGGLPPTPVALSSKGPHYYLKLPEGVKIKNNIKGIIPGCDIKTTNGYIVAPPSLHYTGHRYKWIISPDDCPFAFAPDWLLDLCQADKTGADQPGQTDQGPSGPTISDQSTASSKLEPSNKPILPIYLPSNPSPYAQAGLREECEKVRSAQEGSRNKTLNNAAFALGQLIAGRELDPSVVESELTAAALGCGLGRQEIPATIRSGIRAGMKQPRTTPPPLISGTIHFNHKGEVIDPQTGEVLADQWKGQAQGRVNGKQGQSQADKLLSLVGDVEFFLDTTRTAYASFEVEGVRQTHPVRSRGFKDLLGFRYYAAYSSAPSTQAIQDTVTNLEGRAMFGGSKARKVGFRTMRHGEAIYIDLGNDRWEAVKVTAEGWEVITNPPVHFRRGDKQGALPTPKRGGAFRDFLKYVNVSPEEYPLLAGYMVSALNPDIEYAILNLQGEQGSGKSTNSRYIRKLIDPLTTPGIRSEPRDKEELAIAAKNSYLLAFDNLSHIPDWLSDAFCRISTGGEFNKRGLYTDDEERTTEYCRPVIINGIESLGKRSDFLQRLVTLHTPPINPNTRRSSQEIEAEFETAWPALFGALLDAMSTAMSQDRQNAARKLLAGKTPRMAAFAQWVTAAEPALGLQEGEFIRVYIDQQEENRAVALENSQVATTLVDWFINGNDGREWIGSATELLEKLNAYRANKAILLSARIEFTPQAGWPLTPSNLSNQINRVAQDLRNHAGIKVETVNQDGRKRLWRITRTGSAQDRIPAAFMAAFASDGTMPVGKAHQAKPF